MSPELRSASDRIPTKNLSSLGEDKHTFPPFYACYLLRSKAKPGSQRTYVRTALEEGIS